MAWGLGIDGPSTGVPTITGKQPGAGFFPQAPPVCAEFVEQNGTEHYVTVLATLAALDVNHHPSAINVADLQASQLRVPNTGGIEGHEDSSMKWCASRIDELGYFFLIGFRSGCGDGSAPDLPIIIRVSEFSQADTETESSLAFVIVYEGGGLLKPSTVFPLQSSQQLTCGSKCSQMG